MAARNYLVEGLSGAGKSSVYEELIRRGYRAVSTELKAPLSKLSLLIADQRVRSR